MYFKINGPFGLNICFALELAWEAFQTGAPQTYFSFCLCAVASRLSPGLFTRKMRSPDKSLTDVWLQPSREQGCRDVTILHQLPQNLNPWRWNSALFTTNTAPGVFQDSQKVCHSCEISVALWKMGVLLVLGGRWQTLSIPDCCWDGGCLSPPRPQPVWAYRCPRHTKGKPVSIWQIENFFKPMSFKCKWNLVLAAGSFQQQ